MPSAALNGKAPPWSKLWIIRLCLNIYLAIRVAALGFTLLLPLVGAASSQRELPGARALVLVGVALAFHVFAYVLNDVVDLWVDRTEPLRADSLLVQGRLSRRNALWLALLQPPIAFALALHAGAAPAALLMLGVAFLCLTGYDLYGKRCPWPVLTDALQALGWCALLLFGAVWETPVTRADLPWLVSYVFIYVLLVNGLHGGVRDLANDLERGARTTTVWLGARPAAGSGVRMSPQLIAYGLLLQAALLACGVLALVSIEQPVDGLWPAVPVVAFGLVASTLALLFAMRRVGNRRDLIAAGAAHIVLSLAVLPALYLPLLNPAGIATMLGAFTLPIVAMYLYNGSHWRL
jgi:4-hydroxybenzoate polyprenyltransferase